MASFPSDFVPLQRSLTLQPLYSGSSPRLSSPCPAPAFKTFSLCSGALCFSPEPWELDLSLTQSLYVGEPVTHLPGFAYCFRHADTLSTPVGRSKSIPIPPFMPPPPHSVSFSRPQVASLGLIIPVLTCLEDPIRMNEWVNQE